MKQEDCLCPCHTLTYKVTHQVACCSKVSVVEELFDTKDSCDCSCHINGNKKLHKAIPVCCKRPGERFEHFDDS